MHMKHLKHTLTTRTCNIRGRNGARGVAGETCSGFVHSGSHDVAPPVLTAATTSWWATATSATPRRGEGRGTARRGGDRVRWGMEHGAADVVRLDV
jgi:hypothetical protein